MKRDASVRLMVLALAATTTLAGCHRQPAGQVVATVDGKEITRRDLLAELRAVGGQSEADLNAAQGKLTSALVDRQLLVEEAKREKLDKNPEFLAAEKRQHDIILAQMLAQTFASHVQKPDAAAIQNFINSNPQMFSGRKLLQVSEISAPSKGINQADLAPLHGQQAVVDYLSKKGIKFAQRTATVDTLTLPKQLADQMLALPAGEPLAISNGSGAMVFTTVLQSKDAPVPPAAAPQLAGRALMQQGAAKSLDDELKQLKQQADIKYLSGFDPGQQK